MAQTDDYVNYLFQAQLIFKFQSETGDYHYEMKFENYKKQIHDKINSKFICDQRQYS